MNHFWTIPRMKMEFSQKTCRKIKVSNFCVQYIVVLMLTTKYLFSIHNDFWPVLLQQKWTISREYIYLFIVQSQAKKVNQELSQLWCEKHWNHFFFSSDCVRYKKSPRIVSITMEAVLFVILYFSGKWFGFLIIQY